MLRPNISAPPPSQPSGLGALAFGVAGATAALALVLGTGWAINLAGGARPGGVTTARVRPFLTSPVACPAVRHSHRSAV